MSLSRRTILKGAGALPLAVSGLSLGAMAQTAPATPGGANFRRSCSCMAMAITPRCG